MDVDFWLEARGQTSSQLQSFLEGFSQLAKVMDFSDQKHTNTFHFKISRSFFIQVSSKSMLKKGWMQILSLVFTTWSSWINVVGKKSNAKGSRKSKGFSPDFKTSSKAATTRLKPTPDRKNEVMKSWSHEVMKRKTSETKKNVFECFWTCSNLKENSKYFQTSKAIILQSI